MADFRGIEAVGNALVHLLSVSYRREDFDNDLQFQVYVADHFRQQPMTAGISVFLYRVVVNSSHRIPAGRIGPGGQRFHPQLPLDLHYLLTIWARDASLQHRIAGWMLRTLEDTPVLPYGLFEAVAPGVFSPAETVELMLAELSHEELLRVWETIVQDGYQLSIPYLARNVRLESTQTVSTGAPVQERVLDWYPLKQP